MHLEFIGVNICSWEKGLGRKHFHVLSEVTQVFLRGHHFNCHSCLWSLHAKDVKLPQTRMTIEVVTP